MSNNAAQRAGGGIETNGGSVDLDDVDLFDNDTGASPGNGGGVHVSGAGIVDYDGGEVRDNTASNEGGGLWNSALGVFTATNVVVCDNTAPVGPNVFTQPGGVMSVNGNPVPPGDNSLSYC